MKRIKSKLTALLAAASCCIACLGFGIALGNSASESVTAQAETALEQEFTNNGQFEVTHFREDMPFQFVDSTAAGVPEGASGAVLKITGTGNGAQSNDGAFAMLDFTAAGLLRADVKSIVVRVYQPSDKSGWNFRTTKTANSASWGIQQSLAEVGWHEVEIDASKYTSENAGIMTTISMGFRRGTECYIDSVTVNTMEYTEHKLGALAFESWTASSNFIYLKRADGQAIPKSADGNNGWTATFNCRDGVGVTLNGEPVSGAKVKFPAKFFVELGKTPAEGDVLTVGGTFYNTGIFTQYIVEESSFEWDGTTWIPCIEYTDYEVGALELSNNQTSASSISLKRADGDTFGFANSTFTFRAKGGTGIRLNGERLATRTVKTTANEMSIALGVNAKEGDILTIGGKFYNLNLAAQYVIEDSSFIYENGAWEAYDSDYAQIGVGEVDVLVAASSEGYAYFVSMGEASTLPVDNWEDEFTCIFGVGATLNGETIEGTKILSIDHAICVALGVKAQAGDVLSIGGKFVCDKQGVLYFVKEATFKWDGEAWTEFTEASVNLSQWKNEAKARVDGYSSLEIYAEADQAEMAAIVDKAKADIDACASAITLNKIVNDAKAAMDKLVAPEEEIKDQEPGGSVDKTPSEEESSGCGSVVGLTAGATLAAACAAILLRKKKED